MEEPSARTGPVSVDGGWPIPVPVRCLYCAKGGRRSLIAVAHLNTDRVSVRLVVPVRLPRGAPVRAGERRYRTMAGPGTFGPPAGQGGGRWRLACSGCQRVMAPKVPVVDEWCRRAFTEGRPALYVRGSGGHLSWA